jgi:hypothetical protein
MQIWRDGTSQVRALEKVEKNRDSETVPSTDITRCEARHGSNTKTSGTHMAISGFLFFPWSDLYARRAIHYHACLQ